jgi:hypothetical protein
MKNAKKSPVIPNNPKRGIAKKARGKGLKYIESLNVDEKTYSQKVDPLYQVKGLERHIRLKQIR